MSALLVFVIFGATKASAAITINMRQTGGDVVFDFSGDLDLASNSPSPEFNENLFLIIWPGLGAINFAGPGIRMNKYEAVLSGPSSFGLGGVANPDFSTFGGLTIDPEVGDLYLPQGYLSGDSLSGSMTFQSDTFDTLGIDDESAPYVWTIAGSGDTITLRVVPEPSSALLLAGLGAAFSMRRRRR